MDPKSGPRTAFWPTVLTVAAMVLLIGMGAWQLYRLNWKLGLIAEIESKTTEPAVPLPAGRIDPVAWAYRPVTLRGRFDHGREVHVFAPSRRGNVGYHVYTAFDRADGGGRVIVNRGWIPTGRKDPETRAEGQIDGDTEVSAYVRRGNRPGAFKPDNEVEKNIWFHPTLSMMADAFGMKTPATYLEVKSTDAPGGLPVGGQTRLQLRNHHLAYALTWFSLAIAFAVIYWLWRRRLTGQPKR
jgi:surfeit locus 1 family protein